MTHETTIPTTSVKPSGFAGAALGSVEKHDSTVLFQVFNPQIPLDLGTEVVHDA